MVGLKKVKLLLVMFGWIASIFLLYGGSLVKDVHAAEYIVDWKPNIVWDESNGVFNDPLGKGAFKDGDDNDFFALPGDEIRLKIRHRDNANNDTEQWGVWLYDGISSYNKIKQNNLLNESVTVDESGNIKWVNRTFLLTKSSILDVLYANHDPWYFEIREVTDGTGNSIELAKATLKVTPTPVPASLWLLACGMAGVFGLRTRKR